MDWANEEYVKVYRRETDDDLMLSWQALALWRALLLKLDRAGLINTKRGARGLAVQTRMPLEVVEPALAELLEDGRLQVLPEGYFAPNFLAAQETPHSDKQRKRDERQRRSDKARASAAHMKSEPANIDVTRGHAESRGVTPSHAASQPVTLSSAEPLLSKPDSESALPRAGAHAIPPNTEPGWMPAAPTVPSEPPAVTPAARAHADRRRKLITDTWAFAGREFAAVQADGIDPEAPNTWIAMPDASSPPMVALRGIVDQLLAGDPPDYAGAEVILRRRILVAAAEARREDRRTAEYMTPPRMWNRDSFEIAAAMSPEQAARGKRAAPRAPATGRVQPVAPDQYQTGDIP